MLQPKEPYLAAAIASGEVATGPAAGQSGIVQLSEGEGVRRARYPDRARLDAEAGTWRLYGDTRSPDGADATQARSSATSARSDLMISPW